MKQHVPGILEAFDADDEVRVVVVTGAGERAFISGADVTEFGALRSEVRELVMREYAAQERQGRERVAIA